MPNDPLIRKEDSPDLQTIQGRCAAALNELIATCIDGRMTTFEIADVIEREIARLRQPYQNPEDNEAEATQ